MVTSKHNMPRKKIKTSVVLPGGIAGLVHQVQKGGGEPANKEDNNNNVAEEPQAEEKVKPTPAAATTATATTATVDSAAAHVEPTTTREHLYEEPEVQQGGVVASDVQPVNQTDTPYQPYTAPAAAPTSTRTGRPGRPANKRDSITPTERAERDYRAVKDKGGDSWERFMQIGQDYKTRDSKLATIYIDGDLKNVLDRLKTATSVRLPTAAILSSIVANFIFDHEQKVKDVIFGGRLI